MRRVLSVGIGATLLVAACGSGALPTSGLGGLKGSDHISTLAAPNGAPVLDAPDRVQAGATFMASISTLVGGCDVADGVADESTGRSVTLTPYNRNTMAPGTMCPMYITFATRTTPVVFTTPGLDTLSVHGYIANADGSAALGTIRKTIQVTP